MSSPPLESILNYYPFSPRLATGGQPTSEQIAELARTGFQVVINLALPTSPNALPNEAELVTAAGMEYVAIPVVWEAPTLDDLARFFAALEAAGDRPTFVHCALNWRVSCFVYLYRVLKLGLPAEEAVWDLWAIWEPNDTWQQFMATAGATLPTDLRP